MDTLNRHLKEIKKLTPASELKLTSTCGGHYAACKVKHLKALRARVKGGKKEFHKNNYNPWRDTHINKKPFKGENK